MNKELYEMLNSAGEIRIEIGGPEKYHYMTDEEVIELLNAMEAQEQSKTVPEMRRKAA